MNTETFLSMVLPEFGQRAAVLLFPDPEGGRPKPATRWFFPHETAGLLGFCGWGSNKGANAYIAIGGYAVNDEGEYNRTANMAVLHRSLRIDIDCGQGKPYLSKGEAGRALVGFLQASGMPQPLVVDSGGGLHVYWPFTRDVPLLEWLQLAAGLQALCQQHGLAVDTTTTVDAARILRLPGTLNHKFSPGALVRVVTSPRVCDPDTLKPLLPAVAPVMAPAAPMRGQSWGRELEGGTYPTYTARDVLIGCPGMKAMFMTGGAGVAEPLWKAALDLVNKSEDDPTVKWRVAVAISKGHADFTEGGLAQKWGQVQQQDYHPPTCAKMAALGMRECATCPVRTQIKSPVSLGRLNVGAPVAPVAGVVPPPPPAVLPPAPPAPAAPGTPPPAPPRQVACFMLGGGGAAVRVVDGPISAKLSVQGGLPCQLKVVEIPATEDKPGGKAEVWMPIIPYRMLEVERLLDAHGRQSITAFTFDRFADGLARVEATNKDLADVRAFAQLLAANGLHLQSAATKTLQDTFMPAFLTELQKLLQASHIANRCGWTDDKSGFVLGTQLYTATGVKHIRPGTAVDEMEAYHAAGDATLAREAIITAMAGSPDRQAVIALAIATPLMPFTGVDGLMLNAWSPETGVGKSTLCNAALAVWGSPDRLRKDFRDTANATFKLASVVGNLPMVVDEFTNVDGRQLSDYVYTITQGREKHRLTSDARLNSSGGRWCLAAIATSNNSVHDKLQAYRADAVAEAARVFELRLSPIVASDTELAEAKSKLLALRGNYGHMGPSLAALLVAKGPDYWQELVTRKVAWWDREVANGASDRFRSACAALVEIGAAIGKAMGLPFDVPGVIAAMRAQWQAQVREFDAARKTPEDFVNEYVVHHLSDAAIIGGQSGNDMLAGAGRRCMVEIRGRTDAHGKFKPLQVIVPIGFLRDFVRERNGNFKGVQDWLARETHDNGLVERVGRSTFLAGQPQQVRTNVVVFRSTLLGVIAGVNAPPAPNAVDARRGAQ